MICPHCSTAVKYHWETTSPIKKFDNKIGVDIAYSTCPNCDEIVISLRKGKLSQSDYRGLFLKFPDSEKIIYPREISYNSLSGIPEKYLTDFDEARRVLSISPKSSAALTRRILQFILREEYNIRAKNLSAEIEKFINSPGVPSHISDAVDAVRIIGNLAAHPTKDNNTGEIVDVEKNEAEWLIEVIDTLFDFTFIQPEKLKKRQLELQLKLEKAKGTNKT